MHYASLAQLIQLSKPTPHKPAIFAVTLLLCLFVILCAGSHTLLSLSRSQDLLSHALLHVLYKVFIAVLRNLGSLMFYVVFC